MNYLRPVLAVIVVCLLFSGTELTAQKLPKVKKVKKKKEQVVVADSLSEEEAPLLELEKKEEKEAKKKKRKKNVFYGLKTRKGRITSRSGAKQLYEEFYYLREYQAPNSYVPEKYFYDTDDRKIKFSANPKTEDVLILHGPYKRYLDGQLIVEGIFYVGTKHGRWMEYFSNDVLRNKEKFYRGWPKESQISFYDTEATKVKEVIPVRFGKKEGTYYYFHDNGLLGVTGNYENDQRVGVWREFYKYRRNRRNRKKEIQFAEDGYDRNFQPYIIREWNQEGRLLYDHKDHKKEPDQS